ncbi:L-lactate permease [Alicyclobacillus dauci]|uniref:L-lactate permease n=1 Tax=Alicyclobacillus dauci TaxID=1475485 RepID=A0ABY6YXA7_9BACL|nr:L-lactate permease [Alicyclobacillus dauci]WAH35228.1 L-lactate permease [Alicyclobacillus dauci]
MHWSQYYTPVAHSVGWSALLAVVPILYFFWALAIKRMKGHTAAVTTVILAIIDSVVIFRFPLGKSISSTIYGMFTGLWPIGWIVVAAVFLYKITEKTGYFDIIRQSISSLTEDRRIQALLIAFSFGAFLEGAAGFGAPVAIAGAMLVGLGFEPIYAAGICLIADTAPVAFGAIGIPITAMATSTHSNAMFISQMVGRQLPVMSLILPFWLVVVMSGWKGLRDVFPAALTAGLSFAVTQYLISNFVGPELPDILASLVSLIAVVILLRFWQPKHIFRFPGEQESSRSQMAASLEPGLAGNKPNLTGGKVFRAWSPFLVLTVVIIIWTLDPVKKLLAHATITFNWPDLDKAILKVAPIAAKPTALTASFKFDILGATGTAILIAAFITMFICRQSFRGWLATLGRTLYELRYPMLTIACVVGFGQLMNYSGMSATMAMALAATGVLFPFFAPLLGWIGVFLTGSDTSSNLLFGSLQQLTAQQLHLSPYLTMGANSSGGVMGKMISPQSIAVGTSATGLVGQEGNLYRFTIKHSLWFLLIVCIITTLQAYVFPGMIPS